MFCVSSDVTERVVSMIVMIFPTVDDMQHVSCSYRQAK